MSINHLKAVDPLQRQPALTADEKALQEAFVKIFLRKRNPIESVITLGIASPYAADWASFFMSQPYVMQLIAKYEQHEETEEDHKARKRKYRAMLEEQAAYYGDGASHSARVAAIAKLLELEDKTLQSLTNESDELHVMEVPGLISADEWEKHAKESQKRLAECQNNE